MIQQKDARKTTRRVCQKLFYDYPVNRRVGLGRRCDEVPPPQPGAIRPGVGEAAPRVERRARPESGLE